MITTTRKKRIKKTNRSPKPLALYAHLRVNVKTGLPYFVQSRRGNPNCYLITDRPLRNKAGAWRSVSVVIVPCDNPSRKRTKR